jgi:hypothetical protein
MNFVDLYSLMLHRLVAEKLIADEKSVLQIACKNLKRWLSSESFAGSERFALLEWQTILQNSTPEEIRKIITQDTDEGQRLRSSSPFAGVLDKAIRDKVWSEVTTAKDTNYTKKGLHFYLFCVFFTVRG